MAKAVSAPRPRRTLSPSAASLSLVVGGLLLAIVFVPFTITHGPTSINLENEIAGWDMHRWGMLMGTLPNVLIALGLWSHRQALSGPRRSAAIALTVVIGALVADALMNSAFRALGPPFCLVIAAPALGILAWKADDTTIRLVSAALALAYAVGIGFAALPQETFDRINAYRVYGSIVYALGGVLWSCLGASLWLVRRN